MKLLGNKLGAVRGGINRLVAILLALVVIMLVVVSIPTFRWYQALSERHACEAAMDTAWRKMAEDYIINGSMKVDEVKAAVGYAMNGWDDICPGGGKVYLVKTRNNRSASEDKAGGKLPYELVCGKHDKDEKLRTRLNADDILRQLQEQMFKLNRDGKEHYPETLTVTYNGKKLTAELVDRESGLKRGTSTTSGLEEKNAVAYYSIVGHSAFGEDSGKSKGEIWYFSFADELHCANWRSDDGWTGDSFQGLAK